MRAHRQTLAALVVGFLVGILVGLFIAGRIEVTSEAFWSLVGSALGAVFAIAGGIWLFHYESNEAQLIERRRLASDLDEILPIVAAFKTAAKEEIPRYNQMQNEMRSMAIEYRIVSQSMSGLQHASAAIARAHGELGTALADRVSSIADSNAIRDVDQAMSAVQDLEGAVRKARGRLGV